MTLNISGFNPEHYWKSSLSGILQYTTYWTDQPRETQPLTQSGKWKIRRLPLDHWVWHSVLNESGGGWHPGTTHTHSVAGNWTLKQSHKTKFLHHNLLVMKNTAKISDVKYLVDREGLRHTWYLQWDLWNKVLAFAPCSTETTH